MSKYILIFFLFVIQLHWANAENVRVRIAKNQNILMFTGDITWKAFHCKLEAFCANASLQKIEPIESRVQNIKIQKLKNRIQVQSTFTDSNTNKLKINTKSFQLPVYLELSSLVYFQKNKIAETNYLYASEQGISLVSSLDLETYLAGVLPSEMPMSWPEEALKAQAVASRTYVYKQMLENKNQFFHVENSILDQVFKFEKLNQINAWTQKVKSVLAETKDKILVVHNKKSITTADIFPTYYHSDCGGFTDTEYRVWLAKPLNKAVKDDYCVLNKSFSWQYKMNLADIKKAYIESTGDQTDANIQKIQIGPLGLTGRVESMYLFFDNQKIRRWLSTDMRKSIGYEKLKSTRFELQQKNQQIVFSGVGAGHGVGMCQHGAKQMSLAKHNFSEILKFYYPKAKLHHLSPKALFL